MKGSTFKNSLTSILLIMLSIVSIVILHHYKADIHLSDFSIKKKETDNGYAGHIKCKIVSSIGRQNILKIEMAIPCANEEQQNDLKRKMKKIKNDFFIKIDQKQMADWANKGNFDAVKNAFLKIVNQHTDSPVETVYVASVLRF